MTFAIYRKKLPGETETGRPGKEVQFAGGFDSALAWLAAFPAGKPSRVAVITNAGYESVVSADLLVGAVTGQTLDPAAVTACR